MAKLQVIIREPKTAQENADFVAQGMHHVSHRMQAGNDTEANLNAAGTVQVGILIDTTQMKDERNPLNSLLRGKGPRCSFDKRGGRFEG